MSNNGHDTAGEEDRGQVPNDPHDVVGYSDGIVLVQRISRDLVLGMNGTYLCGYFARWVAGLLDYQFGDDSDHARQSSVMVQAVLVRVRDDWLQEGSDGMVFRARERGESMLAQNLIARLQELLEETSRQEQGTFFHDLIRAGSRECERLSGD